MLEKIREMEQSLFNTTDAIHKAEKIANDGNPEEEDDDMSFSSSSDEDYTNSSQDGTRMAFKKYQKEKKKIPFK
jgi:hypothetical protein